MKATGIPVAFSDVLVVQCDECEQTHVMGPRRGYLASDLVAAEARRDLLEQAHDGLAEEADRENDGATDEGEHEAVLHGSRTALVVLLVDVVHRPAPPG